MGGLFWTFNLLTNQLSCWVAGMLYLRAPLTSTSDAELPSALSPVVVYSATGAITLLWLLSFSGFMLSIERRYLCTFYSIQTGKASTMSYFLDNESDELKAVIFKENAWLWTAIRPQVKVWIAANWERWNKEKPSWFTAKLIDDIPDDMIPSDDLERIREGGKRRKSSVLLEMRRFSFQAISVLGAGKDGDEDGEAEAERRGNVATSAALGA